MAHRGRKKPKGGISVKKSILYFDLQGTGEWIALSPAEKSEVEEHCRKCFRKAVEKYNCDEFNDAACRGDDAIAFFDGEHDCVDAGIEFFTSIPEVIRTTPHIEHVRINPRIIAFSDIVSGERQSLYSGRRIENILPAERCFGKPGSFRIVGDLLWTEISANRKMLFNKLPAPIQGKRGESHNVYEYLQTHDIERIHKRYSPPYIPEYQEQLYKFYSTNMVARNSITECFALHLKEKGEHFTKEDFTSVVLNACRAYLELTVSATIPEDKDWKFKLSYWTECERNKLRISAYGYPRGIPCLSFTKGIELKPGENVVGKCWTSGQPVIQFTADDDYEPLHDKRDASIVAVAAFPVYEPLSSNKVIGVLSIDTNIAGYFSRTQAELHFPSMLLSSFTKNLTLANYMI